MPDISKCQGNNCPWRNTCWRYTSPSSEFWQSWINTPGYYKKDHDTPDDENIWVCDIYWPIDKKGNPQ